MSKYVNIEELKKVVNEEFCLDFTKIILNNTINELSSADVVEVVRCKDCKKFRNAICRKFMICTELTDYCSYGERREAGE